MHKLTYCLLIVSITVACSAEKEQQLSSFEVFCEMVANDAKPIALSQPDSKESLDRYWEDFESIAQEYGVELSRESDFPVTPLWPSSATDGKEVVVIYKSPRLKQYHQLKADLDSSDPVAAARRFGRLLGYTNQGMNNLLMENTAFRTLESFNVTSQVTHLYYENLDEANAFYGDIIGFEKSDEHTYKVSQDAFLQLHAFTEEHPKGQPKSTAIAFLTDQLPAWYSYIQENEVPIKYTYKPREGGPHDGFVAIDPGGYLLEFEEFKQHSENELFMAVLEIAPRVKTRLDSLNFFGSITWTYHNDLLKMQQFYEEELGFTLVADQGWTKIYQTAESAFIGLVDERRGMMDYADEKAIEVEWKLKNREEAIGYYTERERWDLEEDALTGPEKYRYLIR